MSTTTELLAANERYQRLRAAVEGLAAEMSTRRDRLWESYAQGPAKGEVEALRQGKFEGYNEALRKVRALLAAVDS